MLKFAKFASEGSRVAALPAIHREHPRSIWDALRMREATSDMQSIEARGQGNSR